VVDVPIPIQISTYVTIQELQSRLTKLESGVPATNSYSYSSYSSQLRGVDMNSIEAAVMKGEREKKLEQMVSSITSTPHNNILHSCCCYKLQKTKKEKDKAVRFIIELIGKEQVANFLYQNAGAPDILDRMMESFAHCRVENSSTRPIGRVSSSPRRYCI
jgi:hypothetical protein